MSSLPPVVTTDDKECSSAPPSGGKKECLGFIASRSNFRHHRRQPGAKLPPKREFWNQKFDTKLHNLITWVNKPDNPLDLRSTAPVSRHKPLYKGNIKLTVSSRLHKIDGSTPTSLKTILRRNKNIGFHRRRFQLEKNLEVTKKRQFIHITEKLAVKNGAH